jgi:AraC family transcriptional regulator
MTMTQTKSDSTVLSQIEQPQPRFENGKPMLIAGLRDHYTAAPWEGIPAQWQRFHSTCHALQSTHPGQIPGQIGRTAYGLCFLSSNGVDYLSGVEVSDNAELPNEFVTVSIPVQRYVVFPHPDHVSTLRDTCEIASKWLQTSGHEAAKTAGVPDFFERYGENFDPRSGIGDVELWVPIKA